MYRTLLFDADQTLIDFDTDMRLAFREMYHMAALDQQTPYSEDVLQRYDRFNHLWWKRFEEKGCTKEELYTGRFQDFIREMGFQGQDPKTLHDLYSARLAQHGSWFPGAKEMLLCLSAQYDLYIVTNGNILTQTGRFRLCGLDQIAKAYFVSEKAGSQKPEKAFFDYVFAHIPGATPETSLVIGDSLSSDILGAIHSHMDSIWYNPHHLPKNERILPTYVAENYADILRILQVNP